MDTVSHVLEMDKLWLEATQSYYRFGELPLSGTIALFTHFSLFFPSFCSLTHIPLS